MPTYECETCTREFNSQHAVDQHMDALDHRGPDYECETCTRQFFSQVAADQHMNALDHWGPDVECHTCTRKFWNQRDADEHMDDADHWPSNYCRDCGKWFQNENNLRQHRNSRLHRGTDISCPFCRRGFATASGVSHHLETSSCPNAKNLNRDTIYKEIKHRDPHGFVTQRLLTYDDDSDTSTIATGSTWNGDYYECYMCHREFGSLNGLNQHLNSPAHKQKLYHCPSRHCSKEFVNLAGLFNHLESETCGYIRFEKVQQSVGGFLTGNHRLIGFA